MRVAGYVRVSTERQQQAQTIEQQVELLRAYVAEHPDWVLREEHLYRDDGYSGARLQRPGLDALRDQAARAAFDVVVLTAPDRLARKLVHQMVVLEELERYGVQVVFLDRPPTDDPHEQLVVQIRGAVAEYERTLIADRMRRGRQAKLRAGQLLPWTAAPYGYRLDPIHPRDPALVTVDPAAASLVQEVFATYAAGQASLLGLAVRLTRRGIPTPTGRRLWSTATLYGILTNPAYIGQAASGRFVYGPAQRRYSALRPNGRGDVHARGVRPQDDWILVPVPALVPEEQFAAVQRRLTHNRAMARRNVRAGYLLRGLVSCGLCGLFCSARRVHGSGDRRDPDRYRYYICLGKMAPLRSRREERCPAPYCPAFELDALVWADLCAVLQTPDLIADALARARSGAWLPEGLQQQHRQVQHARASLARQQERLLDAYLASVLDLATFDQRRQAVQARDRELVERERELLAQSQRLLETQSLTASMTAVCARLRHGLDHASDEQRRELVELLVDRVVVAGDQIEIRYAIPITEAGLHTRFCQLRSDYFHPPVSPPQVEQLMG